MLTYADFRCYSLNPPEDGQFCHIILYDGTPRMFMKFNLKNKVFVSIGGDEVNAEDVDRYIEAEWG